MKRNQRTVILALEGDRLNVLQVMHDRERRTVEKVLSWTLPEGSLLERADAIKRQWMSAGVALEECVVLFPMREAILKVLSIPSTNPQEIQEMLRLQATRLTPLALEDMTLAHVVLEKQPDGYSRVMLALVRRDDIRQTLQLFQDAGLAVTQVLLDAWTGLPYMNKVVEDKNSSEARRLILDVSPGAVTMGLFRGTAIELLRSVPMASIEKDLPEEIHKTRRAHEASSRETLPLYVGGQEPAVTAAHVVCQQRGEGAVVRMTDPVSWPAGQTFPGWAMWAAAMAERTSRHSFPNLLPEADQARLRRTHSRYEILRTLSYALACFGIFAVALFQRFHARQSELARLTQAYGTVASETKDLRRMERKIRAIETQMSQEGTLLRLLAELNQQLVGDVSLRAIDFDRGRAVTLQGNCLSLSDTVRVVEILQKSGLFASVELRSSDVRRMQDRDVVEFTVACQVKHV